MRLLAIPALLLLALAGAALAPSSAAAPPAPSCNGIWATTQTVGPVTVFASPPCYEVSVAAMSCPLAGSWKEVRVQQVAVRVYTCDSPDPTSGEEAAMAPPCTCPPPPQCRQAWTSGPLDAIVSVTLTSDCRVIVEVLYQTVACTEPLDGTWVITQGRVTVIAPCKPQFDPCEPPFECYPATAASIEPPVCGPDMMCTEPSLGICDHPDLCNDAGCPYPVGAERGTDVQVGSLHVQHACGPQDLCSGPMRCTSPFGSSSAALIPPVCVRKDVTAGPVHANVGQCDPQVVDADLCYGDNAPQTIDAGAVVVNAELCLVEAASLNTFPVCIEREAEAGPVKAGFDQCRQDHETFASCSSPQRIHHYHEVASGLVYAQVDVCLPHGPPPDLSAPASNPGPCGLQQRCPAPVGLCSGVNDQAEVSLPVASAIPSPVDGITVSDHCQVDVYLGRNLLDPHLSCLFGEGYNELRTAGPVTVWLWGCSPPQQTETAAAAPPCVCPPPRPLCYEVNRAIAWGDPVQVDDWCNVTVTLEASCGLQGTDQHQLHAGKVTVNYQTCQQPPVE